MTTVPEYIIIMDSVSTMDRDVIVFLYLLTILVNGKIMRHLMNCVCVFVSTATVLSYLLNSLRWLFYKYFDYHNIWVDVGLDAICVEEGRYFITSFHTYNSLGKTLGISDSPPAHNTTQHISNEYCMLNTITIQILFRR